MKKAITLTFALLLSLSTLQLAAVQPTKAPADPSTQQMTADPGAQQLPIDPGAQRLPADPMLPADPSTQQ